MLSLLQLSAFLPTRKTTLIRHFLTVLGNKVTEANAMALVEKLVRTKRLTIEANNKVTYHL